MAKFIYQLLGTFFYFEAISLIKPILSFNMNFIISLFFSIVAFELKMLIALAAISKFSVVIIGFGYLLRVYLWIKLTIEVFYFQ